MLRGVEILYDYNTRHLVLDSSSQFSSVCTGQDLTPIPDVCETLPSQGKRIRA